MECTGHGQTEKNETRSSGERTDVGATRYHKGWMAQFTALVGLSVLTAPASFVNSHWYILCMVVPVLSVLTGLSVSYSLIPPILSVLTFSLVPPVFDSTHWSRQFNMKWKEHHKQKMMPNQNQRVFLNRRRKPRQQLIDLPRTYFEVEDIRPGEDELSELRSRFSKTITETCESCNIFYFLKL